MTCSAAMVSEAGGRRRLLCELARQGRHRLWATPVWSGSCMFRRDRPWFLRFQVSALLVF